MPTLIIGPKVIDAVVKTVGEWQPTTNGILQYIPNEPIDYARRYALEQFGRDLDRIALFGGTTKTHYVGPETYKRLKDIIKSNNLKWVEDKKIREWKPLPYKS